MRGFRIGRTRASFVCWVSGGMHERLTSASDFLMLTLLELGRKLRAFTSRLLKAILPTLR